MQTSSRARPTWGSARYLTTAAATILALGSCAPSCSCEGAPGAEKPAAAPPSQPVTGAPQDQPVGEASPLNGASAALESIDEAPTSAASPIDAGARADDPAQIESALETTGATEDPNVAAAPTAEAPSPGAVAPEPPAAPAPSVPSGPPTAATFFPDLDRASDKAQLGRVKLRIANRAPRRDARLVAPAQLGGLLPKAVAGIAAAPLIQGPTLAGDKPIAVVARLYMQDPRQVYIKMTDTEFAAFMREPFLAALDQVGDAAVGYGHGRMVLGHPVVLRYYPDHRNSQLTALVRDRYLVEVRVREAKSAFEAEEIFKALPLDKLTDN